MSIRPCLRLATLASIPLTCGLLFALASPALALPQDTTGRDQQAREEPVAEDEEPRREILPFPVLISDPTNGFGAGGGLLTLYRLNETEPEDSQTAFFGYYTTTSSWKWGFRQILSVFDDRIRSTTTGIFGNTNNNFSYPDLPSDVVYGERRDKVEADFTYNLIGDLYVGLNYLYSKTDFAFEAGSEQEQEFSRILLGIAGAEKTVDSGLGLMVAVDTRDHEYKPSRGVFGNLKLLAFRDWLGSDYHYRSADAFFNVYWTLRDGHLLAFRFRWRDTFGDVPFTGQSIYGGVDLRAYPTGKYRGNGMIATQVEYRFDIWKRLGGVAFGGTGRVYGGEPTLGADVVLPSGGGGIRFLLLEDRGTQVGLDFATGRFGNSGLYFFFGEAF